MITGGRHTYIPKDIVCADSVNLEFGSFCSIGSGLKIISGQHPGVVEPVAVSNHPFGPEWGDYPQSLTGGSVLIGHDVWIGEDVKIIVKDKVVINNGSVIAAGSIITKDVFPYTIMAGNPARIRRYRFRVSKIIQLLKIAWWDWPDEKISANLEYMKDVDEFLRIYSNEQVDLR